MMARTAAIVGVADTPLRDGVLAEDGTVLQVQARAAKAALDEAGLALRDVDALFAAGSWGVPGPGVFVTSSRGASAQTTTSSCRSPRNPSRPLSP